MSCKLDSTENPRSFEKYPTLRARSRRTPTYVNDAVNAMTKFDFPATFYQQTKKPRAAKQISPPEVATAPDLHEQVPKKCADLDLDLLYILILGTRK